MKIKIAIFILALCLFTGICALISIQSAKIKDLKHELELSVNNNKAYESENSALKGKVIEFQLTTDQLNASKDSIIQRLNNIRKELGIKDKQIKELQRIVSENSKRDTIFLKDSIFRPGVALDTSIVDNWSKLKLHAQYPNVLNVEYSFNNATDVLMHNSRVTVDPPKKCWIGRLFQKKQIVVEIDVVQENPYCETKSQKFVKIIEK